MTRPDETDERDDGGPVAYSPADYTEREMPLLQRRRPSPPGERLRRGTIARLQAAACNDDDPLSAEMVDLYHRWLWARLRREQLKLATARRQFDSTCWAILNDAFSDARGVFAEIVEKVVKESPADSRHNVEAALEKAGRLLFNSLGELVVRPTQADCGFPEPDPVASITRQLGAVGDEVRKLRNSR